MRTLLGIVLLSLSVMVSANPLPSWINQHGIEHPQLGQVLDTSNGEWLSAEQLVERVMAHEHVLVGEKHDNIDHHRLQLWLLRELQQRRQQATLVMEMLGPEQQQALDRLHGKPLPDDPDLQQQLAWSAGWDWDQYADLIRWGLSTTQTLLAANLTREDMASLYRDPQPLADTIDQTGQALLARVMFDSHCGMLTEDAMPAMLSIQQGRDQRMAQVMTRAPVPALLIAGSFHVRKDLGAPVHWPSEADEPVVILLHESGSDLADSRQADYVWLTPATPKTDYCAQISGS